LKVKVCGITSYEDAMLALDLGADALGFNFFPQSPRYIDPRQAHSIIGRLPPFAAGVGLFVNVDSPEILAQTARVAGVQILQLHGDETPDYCRALSEWILIKALRVGSALLPRTIAEEYPVRALLLDARDEILYGGTGKSFDWSLAMGIGRTRPLILAGGLHAGNVSEAIRMVRPYGVDVCSGVEMGPGIKDPAKLAEFMKEVRNVATRAR
jgi:phosphoribosylanthranilate isomerase